jgi:outer membrane immunogenic protein
LAALEISGKSARDMKPFITLTFCAMLFGGLALAQEPVAVQRSMERSPESVSFALLTGESFSWTGLYIGGNLGGSLNNYEFNDRDVFFDTGQQFNENFFTAFDIEGGPGVIPFFIGQQGRTDGTIMGGGQIGGMFQFGHFVVGIEGDFDRLAAHESRQFGGTDFTFIGGDFGGDTVAQTTLNDFRQAESDWNASVRGKLGWAHGPLLFYATGGIAWSDMQVWGSETARTDFFIRTTPGPFPANFVPLASTTSRNFDQQFDDTYVGWTAGAGVDLALTDVLTVALEYRHSDFGDNTFNFNDHGGPFFTNFNSSNSHGGSNTDLNSDQVTVRVNLNLCRFFFGSH